LLVMMFDIFLAPRPNQFLRISKTSHPSVYVWRNFSLVFDQVSWSKFPPKYIQSHFYSHQVLFDATNKHKYLIFGLQLKKKIQNTDFFGVFCHFFDLRGRGAQVFRLIFAYFDFAPP
jgi:hypothetical protein